MMKPGDTLIVYWKGGYMVDAIFGITYYEKLISKYKHAQSRFDKTKGCWVTKFTFVSGHGRVTCEVAAKRKDRDDKVTDKSVSS